MLRKNMQFSQPNLIGVFFVIRLPFLSQRNNGTRMLLFNSFNFVFSSLRTMISPTQSLYTSRIKRSVKFLFRSYQSSERGLRVGIEKMQYRYPPTAWRERPCTCLLFSASTRRRLLLQTKAKKVRVETA